MGRLARFIPPDSYFHILSRGNNRQIVFLNDADFEKFLEFLKFCTEKFVWKVIHYVFPVKPGRIIFELGEMEEETAKQVLKKAAAKLPIKTRFIKR